MSTYHNIYEEKLKEIQKNFEIHNEQTDLYLYQLFRAVIIHSFTWSNIPEFIKQSPDYIEESLSGYGKIAFFKMNDEYYLAPAMANGKLLKNGLYSHYTMVFRDGQTVILPIEEIELCNNNFNSLPSDILLREMVYKCSNALKAVDRALDKNTLVDILLCKDEITMGKISSALEKSYEKKIPIAVTMGDWINNDTKFLTLTDNRAIQIKDIYDVFIRYRNLFLTTFGINTVEISKAERLTLAEGSSNDEIVQYTLFGDMYEHRKDFCKRVKEHFNYELSVIANRGIDTTTNLELTPDEKIELKNKIIAPYSDDNQNPIKEKTDLGDDKNE